MSRVLLDRVTKVFPRPGGKSIRAVHDLSLEVADQECLVLVGPSGSGKTTTLRLIAGLERATSGSLSLDGTRLDRVQPKDRDVAMVFQHHALYPHQTVYENLAFGLKLRHVPRAETESRVREIAHLLGLASLMDVFPANLSGGERQRVALGRALVRRPKVLLCDEPLSQLDAPLRVQMRSELMRLRNQLALTLIYVTHDQAEALTLGDRVAVLNEGKLQQVAPPRQLYREPANLFVAGFIGSPPMNIFRGTLLARNGGVTFHAGGSKAGSDFTADVDAAHASGLAARAGQPIVLGMRPEYVNLGLASSPRTDELPAVIRLVEPAGAEAWVHCEVAAHRFAGRSLDPDRLQIGDTIYARLDMARAHYFDPLTQQALC